MTWSMALFVASAESRGSGNEERSREHGLAKNHISSLITIGSLSGSLEHIAWRDGKGEGILTGKPADACQDSASVDKNVSLWSCERSRSQ